MIELNKVYNEDCLIGMQRIADKSVDMILCDLPYGTTACKWDVIIPFEPLWKQYERIIKDNGAIVLTASQPFTSALVMSNPKLFKYEWIWKKNRATNFLQMKYQPAKEHENICVFYKKAPIYNAIKEERAESSKKRFKSGLIPYEGEKRESFSNIKDEWQGKKFIDINLKFPSSVQSFNVVNVATGTMHPNQKPVALFEYLIKTYTHEGETVLDNCAGSGTTMIACINTKRNYIGFEKEEKYCHIIQDRIKKHTPQLSIFNS